MVGQFWKICERLEKVFFARYLKYRVVCSYNPERPERLYIDICRDGFCSHDLMFKLQKEKYHDDKLERVFNDSRGIMLQEGREDGSISLIYTYHTDKMARIAQAKKRQVVDPAIIRTFKRMKEEGCSLTFSVPVCAYQKELGEVLKQDGRVESLQDEIALKETLEKERLLKLKKIRADFYASRKYASAPHLALMLKQMEYSGD